VDKEENLLYCRFGYSVPTNDDVGLQPSHPLPAQFARGRTASLTARTAKFTAQVSSKQHIMLGPLLFFPSPRRENFFHVMPAAAAEDRNLSCSRACKRALERANAITPIF